MECKEKKRSLFYYLNDDNSTRECDVMEWCHQLEEMNKYSKHHLGFDEVKGYLVSTIWIGSNMNYSGVGPPLIFETLIFNDKDSMYCEKYSTWDEAIDGHERAIQWVKNGCMVDEPCI